MGWHVMRYPLPRRPIPPPDMLRRPSSRVEGRRIRRASRAPQDAVLDATPHLAELEKLIRQAVDDRPSR